MIDNETAQPPVQKQREPSHAETAAMIADTLGETAPGTRQNIVRIVQALGRTQSHQLLAKALEIEENGGMMLPDNSRRRTVGGIFFHLAYTTGKPKPGKTLVRPQFKKPKQTNDTQKAILYPCHSPFAQVASPFSFFQWKKDCMVRIAQRR